NDQGEGTITLPVGDFNGELRVMAQAWSDDRFGSGESKVIVAAPVIAEMSTPRFLAGGDTSRLALDVTNLTEQPQQLNVTFSASGLVRLDAQSTQQVNLKAGGRTTLFVPVAASNGFGDGAVQAQITGLSLPGERFAPINREWKIGVRPAYPAQTINSGAMLRAGEIWTVPATHLQGLNASTLEGRLLLSGRPPLNIARYIEELRAYPYGCLEQTTSGLFPSLCVRLLSERFTER
ncbi:alpha-2-macroglobulin family protein, partial [Staphylococcus aureus]|nr:alpha-2-macroglobulin family protein [Staphylococcus aureus]